MKVCVACSDRFDMNGWTCPSCGYTPEMRSGYRILSQGSAESWDGFDPNYFGELVRIEGKNWWFCSRRILIVWALSRYFPKCKNFLEVGCGTGFMLSGIREAFPGLLLSGGDFFLEGLAYARNRLPKVSLFQMDTRRIPFDEEFDVIGAFDVLEHIEEDEEVLSQIFKAVKRGGGVIMTVPQHPFLWSEQDQYSFHKRRYMRKELIQKVEKVGFRKIWWTSFVFFLLPLMLLVRLGRREGGKGFDVLNELRIGSFLNQVLLRIMSLEIFMICKGLSLPLGGSLLLVAEKA